MAEIPACAADVDDSEAKDRCNACKAAMKLKLDAPESLCLPSTNPDEEDDQVPAEDKAFDNSNGMDYTSQVPAIGSYRTRVRMHHFDLVIAL